MAEQKPKVLAIEAVQASDNVITTGLRRRLPDLPR